MVPVGAASPPPHHASHAKYRLGPKASLDIGVYGVKTVPKNFLSPFLIPIPNKGLNRACILRVGKVDPNERTTQVDSSLLTLEKFQAILTTKISERFAAYEPFGDCAGLKLFKEMELFDNPRCPLSNPHEDGLERLSGWSLNLYGHIWFDCDLKAVVISIEKIE